jgi:hypothetical protein
MLYRMFLTMPTKFEDAYFAKELTNALLVPRLVSCSFFAMLSFMNAWLSGI